MNESVFLTKEMLLETQDALAIEKVELKSSTNEVRGYVFVREMTAKEKDIWESSLRKEMPVLGGKNGQQSEIKMNLSDYRAKLAICTICNEKGERQFEMNPNTISKLSEKLSASNMERIANAASKLNKITEEDQEAVLKNLEADQNASSSFGSA